MGAASAKWGQDLSHGAWLTVLFSDGKTLRASLVDLKEIRNTWHEEAESMWCKFPAPGPAPKLVEQVGISLWIWPIWDMVC